MNIVRFLSALAVVSLTSVATAAPPAEKAHGGSATHALRVLDKTVDSGYLQALVSIYPPPDDKGRIGKPVVFPARLLFARPDRFRIVLRPGAKDEYRAIASAGVVRWLDLSTGLSGIGKTDDIVDPTATALLGSAGELTRFAPAKELPVSRKSDVRGARLFPRRFGTSVAGATAWFAHGHPAGFEFMLVDGSRIFISVLQFRRNVPTKAGDFQL